MCCLEIESLSLLILPKTCLNLVEDTGESSE